MLALKQSGRQGGDAAEHLAVGIDDVPTAVNGFRGGYIRPHETMDPLAKNWHNGKPKSYVAVVVSVKSVTVTWLHALSNCPIKLERPPADT